MAAGDVETTRRRRDPQYGSGRSSSPAVDRGRPARRLGDNRMDAVTSLVSMGTTMIGISFGALIGLALGAVIVHRLSQPERLPQPT
jgi:hypothetical protein